MRDREVDGVGGADVKVQAADEPLGGLDVDSSHLGERGMGRGPGVEFGECFAGAVRVQAVHPGQPGDHGREFRSDEVTDDRGETRRFSQGLCPRRETVMGDEFAAN